VSAAQKGRHLLGVVCELYTELGYGAGSGSPSEAWLRGNHSELWEEREMADDLLVAQLREALAKLACAAQGQGSESQERAVRSALDGTEMVMRAEIAARREELLGTHLPGFVFMVTLPGLGRTRALELSKRAEELVDRAE